MKSFCIPIFFILIVLLAFIMPDDISADQDKSPFIILYIISGKDDSGEYKGTGTLIMNNTEKGQFTVTRDIVYKNGIKENSSGTGSFRNDKVTIRFGNPSVTLKEKTKPEQLIHLIKPAKNVSFSFTGKIEKDFSTLILFPRKKIKNKMSRYTELWTLKSKEALYKRQVKKISAKSGTWNTIPVSIKKEGFIHVTVKGETIPRGLFLPTKEKKPALHKFEENDNYFLPVNRTRNNDLALPSAYDNNSNAIWIKYFVKNDINTNWEFCFFPEQELQYTWFEIEMSVLDHWPFEICNPWVNITINPEVVAAGEPMNITVDASAFAGLDMFWWFGSNTGITGLDKAYIQAGNGQWSNNYTWTITIDQPGTYTFGANARDLLYWTEHGVPHQASEGCGLAYDTVTVLPGLRKAYSVAFILLAPEGTDVSSDEFQDTMDKLEDIKINLQSQFERSTYSRGSVDVTYPVIVLTPPGPVYGIGEDSQMWSFLKQTISNDFYTNHPDIFDFLAIYEIYPGTTIGSRHMTVKTFVAGFDIYQRNNTAEWGSSGRLQGVGLVDDARALPSTYNFMDSEMHLLLHEVFGHQWGIFADYVSNGYHFNIGIESPTFTVLYGRPWRKIDETHFTTENIQDPVTGEFLVTFHPWVLYVAGMKARAEIPEVLMNVIPDIPPEHRYDLVTTTGTYTTITLQSVIDACGDRYDVAW